MAQPTGGPVELDLECTERCPEVESLPAYMAALALNPGMDLSADHIHETGDGRDSDDDAEGITTAVVDTGDLDREDGLGETAAMVNAEGALPDVEEDVELDVEEVTAPTLGNPDEFVASAPQTDKGEPKFEEVDNPFGAGEFLFRPKFEKGKYTGHYLPTGATAVPVGDSGTRMHAGWEFKYGKTESTGVLCTRSGDGRQYC